jgi:hypothetical protein
VSSVPFLPFRVVEIMLTPNQMLVFLVFVTFNSLFLFS